jgi:hypothetical protein
MLSCTGVLVVGVTNVARGRERERERPCCQRVCVCQRESPPLSLDVPPVFSLNVP